MFSCWKFWDDNNLLLFIYFIFYFLVSWAKQCFLKGSYDAFLKIINLCVWCNRICWHCFNVQKTQNFSNTVHYCRSSMPRLSQTHPTQSALIGQLTQCIVFGHKHHRPRRKCNVPFYNRELQLSKLKTVNNVLSFTISSSLRGEQSCKRHNDDARMCLHTCRGCGTVSLSHTRTHTHNAALWPSLSFTHTHTQCANLRIWTVNSKCLN